MVNVAIVRADVTVANSPEDKAVELKKFWGNVFSAKAINVDEAATFLQSFAVKLAIPEHAIPTVAAMQAFLRKTMHSAPGSDGIPYCCWRKRCQNPFPCNDCNDEREDASARF